MGRGREGTVRASGNLAAGMTRLVLVRHGESVATVERRIGGVRTCGGLSPLGRKQAEALAARLARTGEISADVLVASTMRRAVETAEIIAPALGDLPIEQIAERGRARARPGLRRPDASTSSSSATASPTGRATRTSSASPAARRSPSSSTAPPPPCTGWPQRHDGATVVVVVPRRCDRRRPALVPQPVADRGVRAAAR